MKNQKRDYYLCLNINLSPKWNFWHYTESISHDDYSLQNDKQIQFSEKEKLLLGLLCNKYLNPIIILFFSAWKFRSKYQQLDTFPFKIKLTVGKILSFLTNVDSMWEIIFCPEFSIIVVKNIF